MNALIDASTTSTRPRRDFREGDTWALPMVPLSPVDGLWDFRGRAMRWPPPTFVAELPTISGS